MSEKMMSLGPSICLLRLVNKFRLFLDDYSVNSLLFLMPSGTVKILHGNKAALLFLKTKIF